MENLKCRASCRCWARWLTGQASVYKSPGHMYTQARGWQANCLLSLVTVCMCVLAARPMLFTLDISRHIWDRALTHIPRVCKCWNTVCYNK